MGLAWFSNSTLALILLALLTPACAAKKWTLRTQQPVIGLQWPYQPNRAKVTFAHSLTGLVSDRNSREVVSAIVFGTDQEDRNTFLLPVAVSVGADGRLAVADMGRRCVHLYLPAQQRYVQLSGSAQEQLASPVGLVFDEELRLYVADSSGKIFAFGPEGAPLSTWRQVGAERFQRPTGITYSPDKKLLYVVDTLANKVHALKTNGELAFSFGERGEKLGAFNFPTHIFRSAAGELYVTDALNFRIAVFDEIGTALATFGHHGDGSGDLAMPKGVVVDKDGIVYVVDGLFDNVQLFNRRGDFLLTLGRRGTDFGEFWLPSGAFISGNGELYVCDTYNRRVQVFRITQGYANDDRRGDAERGDAEGKIDAETRRLDG